MTLPRSELWDLDLRMNVFSESHGFSNSVISIKSAGENITNSATETKRKAIG